MADWKIAYGLIIHNKKDTKKAQIKTMTIMKIIILNNIYILFNNFLIIFNILYIFNSQKVRKLINYHLGTILRVNITLIWCFYLLSI